MRTARTPAQPVERQAEDWYPTPEAVTRALVAHIGFAPGGIWEPACGDGRMARPLIEAGYAVASTDLHDRGWGIGGVDFLTEQRLRASSIITNPPFARLAPRFAGHALALGAKAVAMLLGLDFLGGLERGATLWPQHPPRHVLISSRRFEMWPGDIAPPANSGGSTETFAWFVWGEVCALRSQAQLQWFDWRDFERAGR